MSRCQPNPVNLSSPQLGYTSSTANSPRRGWPRAGCRERGRGRHKTGLAVFLQAGGFALDREVPRHAGLPERQVGRVLPLGARARAPATLAAVLVILLGERPLERRPHPPLDRRPPAGALLARPALACKRRFAGRFSWRRALTHALSTLELVLTLATGRAGTGGPSSASAARGSNIACLWLNLDAYAARPPPLAQLLGYAKRLAHSPALSSSAPTGSATSGCPCSRYW